VNLTVHRNEREAASAVADMVAGAVRAQPGLVLGLCTGRTAVAFYRQLVALHARDRLDLSAVTTFNLDEFWRLPAEHPGSYRAYMERHLFGHVNIAPSRIHFLDGGARDAAAECARFDRAIAAAGGIDLQVLGVGPDGQVGFNEPGTALHAHTHQATLRPQTRRANAGFFGNDASLVLPEGLSTGLGTILGARRIVVLAVGRGKGRAVERMVNGPLTTRLPASFLQLHAHVDLVTDEAAAERLTDTQRVRR
jgi:glucosamine-6-phosphate deaminase